MPAISVEGLVKRFGELLAVDHVSLTVEEGEVSGFIGPNGSGKTTTMRLLTGLLRPDAGRGRVLGHDILTEGDAIRRQVGYMTQTFSLWPDLTVEENLRFIGRLYGVPVRSRLPAVIEEFGLGPRRRQRAGTLSGGWKQRLALAAALFHEPRLLLLDEPTAGVDPKARRAFWDEIHHRAASGLTVLVSTHYMDEAERCHRVNLIAFGRLLASGAPQEIVARSGLHTVAVSGPGLMALADRLKGREGVLFVAPFGRELHVVGPDPERLVAAVTAVAGPDHRLRTAATTLEDVFIHFITREEARRSAGARAA